MDAGAVERAITLDPAWVKQLRETWVQLMTLAVWGDVKSSRLGALPKFRKRLLEVGERLRSLSANRDWIPHPREQLKNALASSINLKDSLLQMERSAQDIDSGAELPALSEQLLRLHNLLMAPLAHLEYGWANLLETQYHDESSD